MPESGVEGSNLNLKQRVGRVAAAVGVLGASLFGVEEAKPVSAGGPVPTPTSTAAPTTADLRATRTALETQRPDLQARATEQARINALQEEFDALRGTPTKTPTPNATARAEATIDAMVAKDRAAIQATATARAMPTATSSPRPVLTPTPVSGDQVKGDSPKEIAIIGVWVAAMVAIIGFRNRIRNFFRRRPRP